MNQKQYAAFFDHIKTLNLLRQSWEGIPGDVHVQKALVLSREDFAKLGEDISPEYPFIQDNASLMSAWPGGRFDCLLVTTEDDPEGILVAKEGKRLYLAYVKDSRKLYIPHSSPRECIPLEEPKAYQEQAAFFHHAYSVNNMTDKHPECETSFRVEQVVVLSDEEYLQFQETGLMSDQVFLFDQGDRMWFDPQALCWHCVLVKGETSKDGILVEAEGYAYARYAAYAPDCDRLRLRDVPVHYEPPAKPPEKQKNCRREETR